MSSTMMMERTGMMGMMGMPGVGMPGMGTSAVGTPTGVGASSSYVMVPRCNLKFEKCTGGMKISCSCEDKMACSVMQNVCNMLMLQGSLCTCSVMLNGMTVCTCNLTMGLCKCEMTETGVVVTCTSGDSKCCEMIQACCDCLSGMVNAGCTCCVMMNHTPVACGCLEHGATKVASKR